MIANFFVTHKLQFRICEIKLIHYIDRTGQIAADTIANNA